MGLGPVPFVLIAEVAPFRVRVPFPFLSCEHALHWLILSTEFPGYVCAHAYAGRLRAVIRGALTELYVCHLPSASLRALTVPFLFRNCCFFYVSFLAFPAQQGSATSSSDSRSSRYVTSSRAGSRRARAACSS